MSLPYKNILAFNVALLIFSFLFSSCSRKMTAAASESVMTESQVDDSSEEQRIGAMENAGRSRKLVKRANLSIRSSDLAGAAKSVAALMDTYRAYAAEARIYDNTRYYYSIRVPSDAYEAFLSALDGIGERTSRSESTEDLTLRYYDLEGNLATLQELLKTFQAYLGKAESIDEIMTVERRIAELQREINATGSSLTALVDSIDYATVDLQVIGTARENRPPQAGLGERIAALFNTFSEFAHSVVLILLGIVIFGIPSLLILVLLYWLLLGKIGLLRRVWRAASAKREVKDGNS
jgi:Flp pilus assembly protein TadB